MKKSFRKGFMQVFSMGWMILIPDIIQQRNTILRILPMREAMWESAFLWRRLLNAMRVVPEKKQDWRKGTSSVPLTGKISQRMKYLMLQTLSAIQIKTVWCLLFTEKVQKMPWKSQSLSQMWNYRLFSMKCWILKSATSALHSLQALPANSIRKLLMTCKNREWRK